MGAGNMRRKRGTVVFFMFVALAKGDVVEHLCDRSGYGRGVISYQSTIRFLTLFNMIYSILADSLELDTSPQCRYRKT